MALAVVGTTNTTGNGTSFGTIVRPVGSATGNLLLVFVACDGSATGGSIGLPTGTWSTLFSAQHPTFDGQWLHGFQHVVEAGDAPGGYSFSSFDVGNTNDFSQCVIEISGQDTVTPLDATTVVVSNSSSNASPVAVSVSAGITTVTNGAMVLYVGAGDPNTSNSNSWTAPSGYTPDASLGANFAPLMVAHVAVPTAGATGAVSASLTLASGNAGFAGALIAVRPAAGGGGGAAWASAAQVITKGVGTLRLDVLGPAINPSYWDFPRYALRARARGER